MDKHYTNTFRYCSSLTSLGEFEQFQSMNHDANLDDCLILGKRPFSAASGTVHHLTAMALELSSIPPMSSKPERVFSGSK
jgi:hypothetical protein